MENTFDLIITGAGPIGIACAIEAEKKGYTYVVLEKGCLVNSLFHYPVNMTFFSTSDRLEVGNIPFMSLGSKPTRAEALEYYRRVKLSWHLNIRQYEPVIAVTKNDLGFMVTSEKQEYRSRFAIIATGFYGIPNLLHIPGEELSKTLHYYREAHPYADTKVAVIGGGNSAVDVALETFRKGAEVTLILKKETLDKGVKYWVRPDIENRIAEGEIKTFFNSNVMEIREKEIVVQTPKGMEIVENDFVFAMTGYQPDFGFLSRCGVTFDNTEAKTPQFDKETFETKVTGLFLAGVVCAGMETGKLFIENSRYHAKNIINAIEALQQ